ncbi:MarC family NAAT transporter [Commensalibacter communis]|uniref:MarC family NAAT transporter n=1 Tax=Commensalibacter communis TaxID=2972786 RepID=UPI0022FF60C2|nr:MarC family NAAT transporter [Commensalibacter communis]CAI3922222.1 MarC family (MarC) (PUBMED:17954692 [Commensalibacter communis]CAI3932988.1 MarC family (MarC) (PUBMED:17954692 [Commensalibacter communis]
MLELFEIIGIGLVTLLPLANPLTAVALFLSLTEEMNQKTRNQQALMAGVYVFIIMIVTWYAGQIVMNTFGISVPGLRIAGGLIVCFIGFQMLFPVKKLHEVPEVHSVTAELKKEPDTNIAFVPLAMPGTAGPGTIAMIISNASAIKQPTVHISEWIIYVAPVVVFLIVSVLLWVSLRSSMVIMRIIGNSGVQAISRLMGFLLVCMGVQFIINGSLDIATSIH